MNLKKIKFEKFGFSICGIGRRVASPAVSDTICNIHSYQPRHVRDSLLIAKFHYTGPTGPDRTGPDQTKSAHFVGDRLYSTTRTRPDPTDCFAARVSEKLRWVRAGLLQSRCWSARLRSGPCSGI